MTNFENDKALECFMKKISNSNEYINSFSKYAGFGLEPFGLKFNKNSALMFEGLTDNILFFLNYYTHFSNLALSRFKWKFNESPEALEDNKIIKLDEGVISSDFIEKMLYFKGSCAVVNHQTLGYIVCDYVVIENSYNTFFEPLKIQAINYASGENLGEYERNDFVIIKNNFLAYPTNLTVMRFCAEFANIDIAQKINIFSQQMPILLQGNEKQKKTMQELVEKIELGQRYIFADKESDIIQNIDKLDIREPFIAKDLYDCKARNISQLLSLMGINNENVNKESGVTSDEVNANDEFVALSSNIYTQAREKSVQELKERFNITAVLTDTYNKIKAAENDTEGGNDDESVYNQSEINN